MTKTLILNFHPEPARSRANAALAQAAATLPDTRVVQMADRYPDGRIDIWTHAAAEAAILPDYDRIVLQFPLQWYSTPPILQTWQDAVLTRMFYIHPEEGARIAGRALMAAVTCGNTADAYRHGGRNLYPMEALLAPLRATANRCALVWQPAFVVYEADKLSDEALAETGNAYCAHLLATQTEDLVMAA